MAGWLKTIITYTRYHLAKLSGSQGIQFFAAEVVILIDNIKIEAT